MKVKSKIKAGEGEDFKITVNHNQTVARGLKIKSKIKAGYEREQHNQTVSRGLRIKSSVKGGRCQVHNCGSNHNQTVRKG